MTQFQRLIATASLGLLTFGLGEEYLSQSLSPENLLKRELGVRQPTPYQSPHGPHREFDYRSVYGAATYAVTAARSVSLPFADVTFNPALL